MGIGRLRAMGLSTTLSYRRNGGGGHVAFGPLHALHKCWGRCCRYGGGLICSCCHARQLAAMICRFTPIIGSVLG